MSYNRQRVPLHGQMVQPKSAGRNFARPGHELK
jgi:hypothetical protein